jgi:cyclohexyl-isocyanide hydratase
MNQIRGSKRLQIGALILPGVDQIDFTGPFEISSRIPGATYQVIAKDRKAIRDARGLILTPERIGRLDRTCYTCRETQARRR